MQRIAYINGMLIEKTIPYNNYINGSAERAIRTVINITRIIIISGLIPENL